MPLKSADVKVTETKTKENGGEEMPVVVVPAAKGKHLVELYNDQAAIAKKAEQQMKELKPKLKEAGLAVIYAENEKHPLEPVTSVKLTDASGAVCRMSFTAKYGAPDQDNVESVFETAGKDINDYIVETVAAKFNDKVFLDADGNFDKRVYEKFRIAIERVAKELGVECPLNTGKVLVVKPDFHERRWKDFTAAQQKTITEYVPNTTTFTPVQPDSV